MASTFITRTPSSNGSSTKATWSVWVKRGKINASENLFFASSDSNNKMIFRFNAGATIDVRNKVSGSFPLDIETERKYIDAAAWYHIVIAIDTTQATSSNRFKMYVNGVQETAFTTETYPSQNAALTFSNTDDQMWIGAESGTGDFFSGSLAHYHYTDGYTYAATDFGETDSTSGVWKPKASPSVSYGTNGFFLKFENSANMDLDSSGNNLSFTTSGNLTQNSDTPANNFATGNPLDSVRIYSGSAYLPTYSNGNNTINHSDSGIYTGSKSTIAVSSGKWYCEAKCAAPGDQIFIGLTPEEDEGEVSETYLYEDDGTFGGSAYGSAYGGTHGGSAGDIIQIAFDATNGTVWFGINGTWQNSATQTEIENGTTANAAASGLTMTKFWHIATKGYNGATWNFNVGSGFFGTTAVASANADGNGFGAFEYAVPSGYYALCTKNLKEFG